MAGDMEQTTLDARSAAERAERVDFKMVTFSLGGKDYGIDIMKVKEIAKFAAYTYVPNSPPFVRGVYNLRGDIISIVDLRIMFHLSVETSRTAQAENGLILRLNDNIIGVVVDTIDKVVGIDSTDVKPPHPIFGDINIKYISGVVEHQERLYIILDVEKMLGKEESSAKEPDFNGAAPAHAAIPEQSLDSADVTRDFIAQTLGTFKGFHVSPVNNVWVNRRYEEWKQQRRQAGLDLQLNSVEDADEFLAPFFSPCTGTFWSAEYAAAFSALLGEPVGNIYQVWNPGAASGHETYSLTAVLAERFPKRSIKVWANDNDLISISTAPNLVVSDASLPDYLRSHSVRGKNGLSFGASLKDRIYFEYHDILNTNQIPDVDLIVARDILSFIKASEQRRVVEEMHELLKPGGMLVLGTNENPPDMTGWDDISNDSVAAFRKKAE